MGAAHLYSDAVSQATADRLGVFLCPSSLVRGLRLNPVIGSEDYYLKDYSAFLGFGFSSQPSFAYGMISAYTLATVMILVVALIV